MSNLESDPQESNCGGVSVLQAPPPAQRLDPREVPLGGQRAMLVRRTLPHRDIRTVGAWCFVDHYGPIGLQGHDAVGMTVPPHPHCGLQTVSWLLEGEITHRDSTGSIQRVRPGETNLMTSGRGIAHSEYSVPGGGRLHGVQLWVALTEANRHQEPHFEHHAELPRPMEGSLRATLIMGELDGAVSPARSYSPLVGVDVVIAPLGSGWLPINRDFEHALLVVQGSAEVAGTHVPHGSLQYLGWGANEVRLHSAEGARVLLLGGEPLAEHLLMWWNFVARTHEEIVQARADWMAGERFGAVVNDPEEPLPAPAMPTTRLLPRPSRPAGK